MMQAAIAVWLAVVVAAFLLLNRSTPEPGARMVHGPRSRPHRGRA